MKFIYKSNKISDHLFLDIIVPQYKESDEQVALLLNSINTQININLNEIRVIIVNDGSDKLLTTGMFSKYNFPIVYVQNEHGGPSVARNVGLELSTADYVMFCDADDMFSSIIGLSLIKQKSQEIHADIIDSIINAECDTPINGLTAYVIFDKLQTLVHGKVYNRKFLIGNNIKWSNNLILHEDVYFVQLANAMAKEISYINEPFYLWTYHSTSLSRALQQENNYMFNTFTEKIKSADLLITELLNRNIYVKALLTVGRIITESYFDLNGTCMDNPKNLVRGEEYKKIISIFYKKYKYLWDILDDKNKQTLFDQGINYAKQLNEYKQPDLSLNFWLKTLE